MKGQFYVQTLAARIRKCAMLNGHFVLHSGKVSDTYLDKYQFEADPALLWAIAQEMAALIPQA
jgi:orotate phosphoribosyltransferase